MKSFSDGNLSIKRKSDRVGGFFFLAGVFHPSSINLLVEIDPLNSLEHGRHKHIQIFLNDENKEIRIITVGFLDFEDLKQDKKRSN
jgi:hypothetical protein